MTAQQVSPPVLDPTGPIRQAIADSLKAGSMSVVDGIGHWLFASLADMTGAVFGFIDTATRPNVTADWFIGSASHGPYRAMATVAATLMVAMAFAGVIQGVAQGDAGAMIRRMVVSAPVAVLGITGMVVVVQILVGLTDALSSYLTSSVGADSGKFVTSLNDLAAASGSPAAPTLILGLLMLVAALVVFIELLVRSLLIYVIVALSPLAWAALVWPAVQGALKKTLELLVAVILSKLVVALALAVGAAAVGAMGSAATTPDGSGSGESLSQSLGLLATGVATLALAAFSPFLIAKLLPFAESAALAQGTRGAPVRAAQQAWSTKYQFDVARRFRSSGAGGRFDGADLGDGGTADPGAGGPPSAGGRTMPGIMGGAAPSIPGGGAGTAGASGATGSFGGASAAAGPVGAAVAVGSAGVGAAKAAKGKVDTAATTQTAATAAPTVTAPTQGGPLPQRRFAKQDPIGSDSE